MRTKQRNNLAETARHERVAQNTDVYAVKARNYKGLRRGSPVLCSIKWRLNEKIKEAFDENHIAIPYPQMDVHVVTPSGEGKEDTDKRGGN